MAAAMAICQAHALIPGLEPNAARASGQAAMRKAGSAHDRAAADNGPGASANPKKAGLGEAKKKLGTDLLKLIDGSYLLPGESSDEVIFRMKKRKQYFDKTDAAGAHLKRKSGQAHGNLAKVYVGLEDSASTDIIDSYAWKVTGRSEEDRLAVALVETDKLEAMASLPGVRSVKEVTPPRVMRGLAAAEGDAIHHTDEIRSAYAQQGAGIKIGVISDGVDHISQAQSSGDLPSSVTVLDNSYGGDEGTAMLEIIHDMAPGADLYFHEGGADLLEFNHAYDDLIAAGCKVIVDDLGWDNEPFFEDGIVGKHLSSLLSSKDIILISAAGNEAKRHYQGTFYDDGSDSHDFSRGTSSTSKYLYATLAPGDWLYAVLQWDDAFGNSGNDYDLALYKKGTSIKLAESTDTQNGNDDPYEWIDYTNNTSGTQTVQIEVERYGGSAKTLELYLWTAGDSVSSANVVAEDSIYGHPNVKGVMAVAAIDSKDPLWDTIESFSSRGPTTYRAETRKKPDITGIDNISVSGAGDFDPPFSGTSAAAPGIAAIAAQLWGAFPDQKGSAIRDAILASAADLGTPGFDYVFGHGRADAAKAYRLLSGIASPAKSSEKAITSFVLKGVAGTINEAAGTITVKLPAGTSAASLAPAIAVSPKATVSPASGAYENFSNPVDYTVTAEDGSTRTYTASAVIASVNDGPPTGYVTYDTTAPTNSNVVATLHLSEPVIMTSEGGKYHTFTENGSWTFAYRDADGNAGSTIAKVANIDKVAPVITLKGSGDMRLSVGDSYTEEGAAAKDNMDGSVSVLATGAVNGKIAGTYAITYTATDSAGNTATATRTITVSDGGADTENKLIASFRFESFTPDVIGIIDEASRKILLTVPYGTNVTALVPTIALAEGATISPASGKAQDFSVPKTYTAAAADGTKQAYAVTVKIDASKEDTVTAANSTLTITPAQKGVLIENLSGNDKVQAEIPKGSVAASTSFAIRQEALANTPAPDAEGAKLLPGLAFRIEAVDAEGVRVERLKDPMTVTMTVPSLPKNKSGLKVYRYDEAHKDWAQATGVVFGDKTITFLADHLAAFAVFETEIPLPANIADGDIIQCRNSADPFAVYIVKIVNGNAYIRHIVSLEIFGYYKHLRWENLKQAGSLDPFSLSGWVRVNTGAAGQPRPGDKVWEINGDQTKHWINMTAEQFLNHGGSDEAIYSVNQGELDLYATGPDVMSL